MSNLSIFLVVTDGDNDDRLYWFGRPSPVINQSTVSSGLEEFAAVTDHQAPQRIRDFLRDRAQTRSPIVGLDHRGRTLQLQRAKHHRE